MGTPEAVANEFERWGDAGADGFVIMSPVVPRTCRAVCAELVPELRARGHVPSGNTLDGTQPQTLRERLFGSSSLPDSHPGRVGPD